MLATRVDAFYANPLQTPDGVNWLRVQADSDIYDHFKSLPEIVKFDNKFFRKMSYNSDIHIINYREISENQIAWSHS